MGHCSVNIIYVPCLISVPTGLAAFQNVKQKDSSYQNDNASAKGQINVPLAQPGY